jgi:hypothetical protein
VRTDGSDDRVLIPSARGYGGDRAVVWFDNRHFAYIDGAGFTQEFDLESGKSRPLTANGQNENGLLMNATRTYITVGYPPTFSPFDAAARKVTPQANLPGCEPYFSHDGRWGYWMGGAGGPINRFELATRQISPIVNKDDPRMPKGRGYLYFPMASRDGRFFAFAASPNQHDHDKSDYDVFVARLNPKTLELIGDPVRFTFVPATDRYPDVWGGAVEGSGAPKDAPPQTAAKASGWPADRKGLVFLFETGDKQNLVPGPEGETPRSYALRPRGRARLDRYQALVLTGGAYLVEGADEPLLAACRKTNQLTVEAVVEPDHSNQKGPARIVTFSTDAAQRNFTLGQEGDKLIFRLRTPQTGNNGYNPEVTLGSIAAGVPSHVAVTYRPGELAAYVNGKQIYRGKAVTGDLQNWTAQHLLVGDEFNGERDWAGTLEGVAIYNRALEAAEVERNANGYHHILRSRKSPPRVEATARLVARSSVPTLDEIKPYRAALVVCKYQVAQVTSGTLNDKEVLVAQWALLDGRAEPVTTLKPGAEVRLTLEPFDQNPQLQRYVCKDDFDSDAELELPRYYDATP